jgi:predicted O-methyltransferase YrrM
MRLPEYRPNNGRLARPAFALVGLRAPACEHTQLEGEVLRHYASSQRTIVEIGVAEGGSAWEMRKAMAADGTLYLIDPYHLSALGALSPARLVAHRLVASVTRASVVWIEEFSQSAASGWSTPIDLLFIDGDHSFKGVCEDWEQWAPHVVPNGHVALHDARLAPWTDEHTGPVRLVRQIRDDPQWELVHEIDSLVVVQRRDRAGA